VKRYGHRKGFYGIIITAAVFVLLAFVTVMIAQGMGIVSKDGEKELIVRAVSNAASTCYAVEGAYPADVQYLKDHYGLKYDEDRFGVYYDAFASNIAPTIIVTEKGGRSK